MLNSSVFFWSAEARVHSKHISCGICDGEICVVTGISPSASVSPYRCHNYLILTYILAYSFTYLFIHLLTPWSGVLLENLTYSWLVKIFLQFYGTWRFITRHPSLSLARSIQFILDPTSWRSTLILFSLLHLFLPSGLFPSISPPITCRHFFSPPYVLHAPPISLSVPC